MKQLLGTALFIVLAALAGEHVEARMPANGPTPEAAWFQQLKQPGTQSILYPLGIGCCSDSDGHRLDPADVRVSHDGHYEFKATPAAFGLAGDLDWHPIPDEKLIRGEELAKLGGNPTGLWVIFVKIEWQPIQHPNGYIEYSTTKASLVVRCAVPPSQT